MKVNVCIDVWNCRTRAFLTEDILPVNEAERVAYIEAGGKIPEYREDIYEILSERDKKRINKIAEPVNISGIRGTIQINVNEKTLLLFLLKRKEEKIEMLKQAKEELDVEKIKHANFAFHMARGILRRMERDGLERIAKAYCDELAREGRGKRVWEWDKIWKEEKERGQISCGDIIELKGKKGKVIRDNGRDCTVIWDDKSEENLSVFQPEAKLVCFSDYFPPFLFL